MTKVQRLLTEINKAHGVLIRLYDLKKKQGETKQISSKPMNFHLI